MSTSRKLLAVAVAPLLALAAVLFMPTASATRTAEIGQPADAAFATFDTKAVDGYSRWVDLGDGEVGVYVYAKHLKANSPYYTVAYSNGVCDPAQAFPVGPFRTDSHGKARLAARVDSTIDVGKTGSISIRVGDTAKDLDKDGKTGEDDVVAVPGKPSIGLVNCDRSLFTVDS